MELYRIVLANEPRLLRGLLHYALAKAADVEVVDEISVASAPASAKTGAIAPAVDSIDPVRLSNAVAQGNADWVIVSLWQNGSLPLPIQRLVQAQPDVAIMGMAADGSRVKVYRPDMDDEQVMHNLSLSDLLATLRSHHRDNGAGERV